MSAQSLEIDVRSLATPQGRMFATAGHRAARAYLVERLQGLRLEADGAAFELPYRAGNAPMCNLIAVAPGQERVRPPVLLAAHYDTCGPLPGADDNAAAVAIALRVAQRLVAAPASRDVIIALFDGEEPPHSFGPDMGSVHWYHHQRRGPVHCAVVMDLVGHDLPIPSAEDLVFVTGMESDPGLVWELQHSDVRVQPVLNRYVGDLSDHMVFRAHQRPYLFVSCGRWEHYHAATDTPDRLNYDKMVAIAELTEDMVRRACAAELTGPFDTGDTLALELAGIAQHFGPILGNAALPRDRKGVDGFVAMAMGAFGL